VCILVKEEKKKMKRERRNKGLDGGGAQVTMR